MPITPTERLNYRFNRLYPNEFSLNSEQAIEVRKIIDKNFDKEMPLDDAIDFALIEWRRG